MKFTFIENEYIRPFHIQWVSRYGEPFVYVTDAFGFFLPFPTALLNEMASEMPEDKRGPYNVYKAFLNKNADMYICKN